MHPLVTLAQIFCSTRRLVEIFYQTSSSRKIATYQVSFRRSKYLLEVQQQKNSSIRRLVDFLLDAQQNFYQTSSRPDDLGHLKCSNMLGTTIITMRNVAVDFFTYEQVSYYYYIFLHFRLCKKYIYQLTCNITILNLVVCSTYNESTQYEIFPC